MEPMARKRKRARNTGKEWKAAVEVDPETRRMISAIVQISASVLLFLAIRNQAGPLGDSIHNVLRALFGVYGALFPAFLLLIAEALTGERRRKRGTA